MGTASTGRKEKTTTTSAPIADLHEQLLPAQALGTVASLYSTHHPLVSVAAAAYVLALLYLPCKLLSLLLSPVSLTLTTLLILVALLDYASATRDDRQPEDIKDQQRCLPPPCPPPCAAEPAAAVCKAPAFAPPGFFSGESYHFVHWARRGVPLEVIYEEYEGDDEDEEDLEEVSPACSPSPSRRCRLGRPDGIGSLVVCCYTDDEDDGDDSGSDSPAWDYYSQVEDLCKFRWEEEEEGLIEISLDEDNLIEIDISGCR